jgi:hypothetical protein
MAGKMVFSPAAEQWSGRRGGDMAILSPPASKADPWGLDWRPSPIHLRYAPSERVCAARELAHLELEAPRHGERRRKDTCPLPNIEANLAALGKANWFTTLDLLQGFHQVMLNGADGSRAKTAFSVENGQYQFTRMPMGLTSSPGAFMRLVDACLRGLPAGIALAYV